MLILADEWKEYELIDMGNGEKLERWGDIVLRRPDPQVVWPMEKEWSLWKNPHGHYHRSNRGGGQWEHKKKYPEKWTINYKNLKFNIKPTGFKHTGLFPEHVEHIFFNSFHIGRYVNTLQCSTLLKSLFFDLLNTFAQDYFFQV